MSRASRKNKPSPSPAGTVSAAAPTRDFRIPLDTRVLALSLSGVAAAYAFLAAMHTVLDLDLGFHLATARYVLQHHEIPSVDVLSYTAPGAEWLYPPFAGIVLYWVITAFGYSGLTWFCAIASVALILCMLQAKDKGERAMAAGLALLAVPELALRASPRPDLFSQLFFALILTVLWRFHSTAEPTRGAIRSLWILPATMLVWVNFHPGFVAGVGLLFAYLFLEACDLVFAPRRAVVAGRLRAAWPALGAALLATLCNPYGLRIYKSALLIAGLQQAGAPTSGVAEWAAVPLSAAEWSQALDWRNPASSFWWLAIIAVVVVAAALWKHRLGAAAFVALALYAAFDHSRLKAIFAITVVVVGSSILASIRMRKSGGPASRTQPNIAVLGAAALLCLITVVRVADLVTSRFYLVSASTTRFGSGESSWFPERAAAFIQREKLPGNIFETYELGGFTSWRLGPEYPDFIDGRFDHLAPAVVAEEQKLLASAPHSDLWQQEADRRHINVLLFPLSRVYGIGSVDLKALCAGTAWRPVYLDEVSIVMLRNTHQNRPWIDAHPVDCQAVIFSAPQNASRVDEAGFAANKGIILLTLGRVDEAKEALERAEALTPDDPTIHFALAKLNDSQRKADDAEREYRAALALRGDDSEIWSAFGRFLLVNRRFAEAREAMKTATQLSPMPANEYSLLGVIDADLRDPQQALADLAKAETIGSAYWKGDTSQNPALFAQIAAGRASAYAQMHDMQRAILYQKEAASRTPENAGRWKTLADMYRATGQTALAEEALEKAMSLSH